ncbi:MAG: N-acetylmuramoyl-L-alanine amidase [Bacteroidales bacterium]|nr:N-acetylmuramoyl-L-alanine amidase [Bacteroidales bacterium]
MKVLIDNGHGCDTAGKCSPDGTLREYAWTREIASRLVAKLRERGLDAERIVTEDTDVPLSTRCRRVNEVCQRLGAQNVLLVSIHVNAADGDGAWCDACGWSGWVYTQAGEQSRRLARILHEEAVQRNLQGNRAVPPGRYWTAEFYILKHTHCPAVLTENLFQDNREDVRYLLSEQGKAAIVQLHVDGILKYLGR